MKTRATRRGGMRRIVVGVGVSTIGIDFICGEPALNGARVGVFVKEGDTKAARL